MGRTLRSGKQGIPMDTSKFIKYSNRKLRDVEEKFADMHLTPPPQSETNGVATPLVLPRDLIQHIKEAVDIIKYMEENKDDKFALLRLETAEVDIGKIVNYRKATKDLPSDWKFDRATAINLLA